MEWGSDAEAWSTGSLASCMLQPERLSRTRMAKEHTGVMCSTLAETVFTEPVFAGHCTESLDSTPSYVVPSQFRLGLRVSSFLQDFCRILQLASKLALSCWHHVGVRICQSCYESLFAHPREALGICVCVCARVQVLLMPFVLPWTARRDALQPRWFFGACEPVPYTTPKRCRDPWSAIFAALFVLWPQPSRPPSSLVSNGCVPIAGPIASNLDQTFLCDT